ncbi:MAG: ABC transporter C-terminal domain-containing protein [Pseudomonadota bacterium]|nr:ABC transporter C-terminal domain-containing protein [Pseudomonadota bacterium]
MSGISDITKLLEQIPIWRTLKALPGRVEALEARVAELEETLAKPKVTPGQPCPACGHHALRRTSSEISSGHFGALGARDEVWTCENCGEEDRRSGVR